MNDLINRGQVQWVNIHNVIPNPLNPRKNDAVKTAEMQAIIKKRGWEEPLTVYKKGNNYVVLAGHRRLHAAKQVGMKEIPIFQVEPPEDHAQELERIASLQSGRVNWTAYEWAQFVYNRWIAWNRPGVFKFAKEINLAPRTVERYIRVLEYFPRNEIEHSLLDRTFGIPMLFDLRNWILRLAETNPDVVNDLGEDLIRKTMLRKLEVPGKATSKALRNIKFLKQVSDEDIREYLFDHEAELTAYQQQYHMYDEDKYESIQGYAVAFGIIGKKINKLATDTDKEKEIALNGLEKLRERVENKIKELERNNVG